MFRNFCLSTALIFGLSLSQLVVGAPKAPIQPDPTRFSSSYELKNFAGKMTFLQLMNTKIKPALDQIYESKGRADNDAAVLKGQGVALHLFQNYWNFHVNYADGTNKNPNVKDEMTGRSYGTRASGQASDPSDAFYLDELEDVVRHASPKELANFYATLIHMIGDCDPTGYQYLQVEKTKNVATDFMAVYGAEEDRHLMSMVKTGTLGSFNWDDALWQVTMVAAFHGGQSQFAKFYEAGLKKDGSGNFENLPVFSELTFDQRIKAYKQPNKRAKGTPSRPARLRDYWQFGTSVNPRTGEQTRSGINVTRQDFEAMGQAITAFELSSANKRMVEEIENIVHGDGKNVFKDVTRFYINQRALSDVDSQGRSLTRDATKPLANSVARLLVQVRADAEQISGFVKTTLTKK